MKNRRYVIRPGPNGFQSIYPDRPDQVYRFIIEHKKANDGNSPSQQVVADALGVNSRTMVGYYLTKLEREGLIERMGPKAIRVVGGRWLPPDQEWNEK